MKESNPSSRLLGVIAGIALLVLLGAATSAWSGYYWLAYFLGGVLITGLLFARILYKLAEHLYTGVIESSKGMLEFSFPHQTANKPDSARLQSSTGASVPADAAKIKALEVMLKEQDLLTEHLQTINAQLETVIKERTAALEHSHATRRNLIANISHDLRTPITLIQGYTEMLLDNIVSTPEEQQKYLKLLHNRVLSLNLLIQDLFDLNQLEAGQLSLRLQPVSAVSLIAGIYEKYEAGGLNTALSFALALPDNSTTGYPADDTLQIDPERIERVFSNLLSNSIHHTPPGGLITVGVTFRQPPANPEKTEALFFVKDTGTGIAAEDLPLVFDRYYQSPQPNGTAKYKGAGLGLAIAKEIVTAHQGQIWAESQLQAGTTFTFSLPLAAG